MYRVVTFDTPAHAKVQRERRPCRRCRGAGEVLRPGGGWYEPLEMMPCPECSERRVVTFDAESIAHELEDVEP